jgi:hypothetical protein
MGDLHFRYRHYMQMLSYHTEQESGVDEDVWTLAATLLQSKLYSLQFGIVCNWSCA